jgi:hypothetical protein
MSVRVRIALGVLVVAIAGTVIGVVLLEDDSTSSKAGPSCTGDRFSGTEFAGCLRSHFNKQQLARGSEERMLKSSCTEVTAKLASSVEDALPEGYRYFGCRIVFSEDGGADAVVAWHQAGTFARAVSIERIRWDDDREPGVG